MVSMGSVPAHRSTNHKRSPDHGDSEFNDPANWDAASYETDQAAAMGEPAEVAPNAYRERALVFLRILLMIDSHTHWRSG